MLYPICKKEHHKSSGAKSEHKMMVKLAHGEDRQEWGEREKEGKTRFQQIAGKKKQNLIMLMYYLRNINE